MSKDQTFEFDDALTRHYEYDDEHVFVTDLGASDDRVSVDVIDGTAILVVEGEEAQHEIDLPEGDAEAFIRNGVVSIEVDK